LESHIVVSIYF